MSYFCNLPSQMNKKHYQNLQIGTINCLVHILQYGHISQEDKERFIDVLERANYSEYLFVSRAVEYLESIDTSKGRVRENLICLAGMLVGTAEVPLDASYLVSSLYHEHIILDYKYVFKVVCNSSEHIYMNELFIKEFKEKIALAKRWPKI